ncbi:hypothetical protein HanIR_Chr09g0423371 [Helianthus annuus]|nr:hypothetical protein HanIR_Chr09g0423371 [Helianthus annuus]
MIVKNRELLIVRTGHAKFLLKKLYVIIIIFECEKVGISVLVEHDCLFCLSA